ncbi:MAG: redox-regulated ATPase YchF [Candidatus Pacearchaeota archaeon]|nr:redox-regulated ATPase YchF [Candidatus Pacearchaeota archaeon]
MLIGIVGKPNVGKSTFFKACSLATVEIGNRPFVTIKPNHGVGHIRVDCIDTFFKVKCNPREGFCIHGQRFVPVELLDVAGLVPGAHEGRGLGNQFLDDLSNADLLIHVVDMAGTTDSEGKPTSGHDPNKDIMFLEEELDYWYLGILKKVWRTFVRKLEVEHSEFAKSVAKQFSGLRVDEEMVKKAIKKLEIDIEAEKPGVWGEQRILEFARELRIMSKPMIIAANKSDRVEFEENFKKAKEMFPHLLIIPCSAESELALREAAKSELIDYLPGDDDFKILKPQEIDERKLKALEFIKTKILSKWHSTGVQDVLNKSVFDFLKYVYVFPGGMNKLADSKGNILPDCYLMPPGTTALDFAFKIHTDIGNNFVKAMDVKKKVAMGKDHVLQNNDVIEIMVKK